MPYSNEKEMWTTQGEISHQPVWAVMRHHELRHCIGEQSGDFDSSLTFRNGAHLHDH